MANLIYSAEQLNHMYVVGAIYLSTVSTSPASLFGGTWEQIQGRFLLGAGQVDANTTSYWGTIATTDVNCAAGEKAGEAWHTLADNELPNFSVKTNLYGGSAVGAGSGSQGCSFTFSWASASSCDSLLTANHTGGGNKFSNMPPYLAVYMWKRTA
jgi:hypothetical protein